jgi:hypothetical protein
MRSGGDRLRRWSVALVLGGLLLAAGCGGADGAAETSSGSSRGTPPAVAETATPAPETSLRVLFVGNSYTFSHELPKVLEQIARTTSEGPTIKTKMVAEPGWTLEQHWEDRRALAEIRGGSFSHVVLQGHSLTTVEARERLIEYGRRFDSAIDESGAQTVLFMTWARRDRPEMLEAVRDGYNDLGAHTDAVVVPVGEAWARSRSERPALHLWHADGSHPSPAGTYLAAAAFYAALTGRSCVGADHEGFGQLDREEIRSLQEIGVSFGLTRSGSAPR